MVPYMSIDVHGIKRVFNETLDSQSTIPYECENSQYKTQNNDCDKENIKCIDNEMVKKLKTNFGNCRNFNAIENVLTNQNSCQIIKAPESDLNYLISPEGTVVGFKDKPDAKGVQSSVFKGAFTVSPTSPMKTTRVLKKSKISFSPDVNNLKGVNTRHINFIKQKFDCNGQYYAICEASKCDLTQVNYQELDKPVTYLLSQLIPIGEGLADIHKEGKIHRDIKGKNLLVEPAKITDVSLVRDEPAFNTTHLTTVTPFYAPPFIWKDLKAQISRNGRQTRVADLFSLGRTIQYDLIFRLLCVKHYREYILPINKFKFTNDELEIHQKATPYLIFDIIRKHERLIKLPSGEELYKVTEELITNSSLNEEEKVKLKSLAALARDLQNFDPEKIPSIEEVISRLKEIK